MGLAKRHWEEEQSRGYSSSDKTVCPDCVCEPFFAQYIQGSATRKAKCSYCGSRPALPLDKLLPLVVQGLETEYDMPENGMGWCSAEGGWLGKTWDTWELLHELGISWEVCRDLSAHIHTDCWCDRDPYSLRDHQELSYDWERFAHMVKHEARYVFFRAAPVEEPSEDPPCPELYRILDALGAIAGQIKLVRQLRKGHEIFRARQTRNGSSYATVEDLGPPSEDKAKASSRMSPAGIPMFYGSLDPATCLEEIRPGAGQAFTATRAAWRVLRGLQVLDLTQLPDLPSLFDPENNWKRTPVRFMRDFLRDFQKPVVKDGREHIDYVPTQVVTEYFRHVYEAEDGERLAGIIYPSAAKVGGQSCVFFCGPEGCCMVDEATAEHLLGLVPGTIERVTA
jgi:hypothetical protein